MWFLKCGKIQNLTVFFKQVNFVSVWTSIKSAAVELFFVDLLTSNMEYVSWFHIFPIYIALKCVKIWAEKHPKKFIHFYWCILYLFVITIFLYIFLSKFLVSFILLIHDIGSINFVINSFFCRKYTVKSAITLLFLF